MKYVIQGLLFVLALGMLVSVGSAQEQEGDPHEQLVGDFRVQSALILSDALMLNDEKAKNVVETYREVGEKLRQEWESSGVNFQSMSNEEQRKFFEDFRKKAAAGMKKNLDDVLSENELKEVEEVMMITTFSPVPEIRGLRLIDLKKEQRKKIQPMSLSLTKKIVRPSFGFFSAAMDETEREKAEKAFNEEKEKFMSKVKDILNEDQNKAWQEKTEEVNKALEEIRQRMRQGQN